MRRAEAGRGSARRAASSAPTASGNRASAARRLAQASPVAALGRAQEHLLAGQPQRRRRGSRTAAERSCAAAPSRAAPLSRRAAPRRASKSSSRPTGPSATRVGGAGAPARDDPRRSRRRRPPRCGATSSAGSNGVPWISMCCASCSQRAEVLSSDISRPAFICALARASSTRLERRRRACAVSSHSTGISSAASSSPVPA